MIRATCRSDDHIFTAKFDAEAFFVQASDTEILDLAICEWGGDYPADAVALHFDGVEGYSDVTRIFEYTRLKDGMGFECHVEKDDVLKWVAVNRPALLAKLCEASGEYIVDFEQPIPTP